MFAFDVGGGSGDDVAGDAAQDVSLVRGQTFQHIVEQGSDDGDEGVAVVIAKGSQPVTLKTDLKNFRQGQFPGTVPFPQFFCRGIAIGRGFVQGLAGFTKRGIDGNDRFPRNYLKPVFNQSGHCGYADLDFFMPALIRCKVATPSLFM